MQMHAVPPGLGQITNEVAVNSLSIPVNYCKTFEHGNELIFVADKVRLMSQVFVHVVVFFSASSAFTNTRSRHDSG